MIIGVLVAELLIPSASSLKDKRMILKSVKDKLRNKFNVSVAEVEFQDKWQRATLAIVLVTGEKKFAEESMQKIFNLLDSDYSFEIIRYSFEYR